MANECLWIKTDGKTPFEGRKRRPKMYDDAGKLVDNPKNDAGLFLIEKLPGFGYVGSDIHFQRPMAEAANRFATFLRDDGHEVAVVLTCAAAHVPLSDTSNERNARLKAKHFGWIEQGKCPCLMVMSGELRAEQMKAEVNRGAVNHKVDKAGALLDAVTGRPCPVGNLGAGNPPCPHYLAERKARRDQRKVETAVKEVAYKSDAEKHTEAVLEATRQNGEALRMMMAAINAANAKASAAP